MRHGETFVEENVDHWMEDKLFPYLTFTKSEELVGLGEKMTFQEAVKGEFKKFSLIFSQTCLLLIDGFFANPYHQEKSRKRGSSEGWNQNFSEFFDSEDSFEVSEGAPCKKRKV